jgi:hypothetical protein
MIGWFDTLTGCMAFRRYGADSTSAVAKLQLVNYVSL